jgi:tripartite-type tricarboxylate transporter receptor subunit TctC
LYGLAALLLVAPVHGQQYPERPVRLVVPFSAGGANDLLARPIAHKLQEVIGQSVVVVNRGGAGGNLGADMVAKSAADGYTILIGSASPLAVNPAIYGSRMPYNPEKDFSPISLVAKQPLVLVMHPSVPVRSAKQLVALARKHPGKLNYGSAGVGTINHLTVELMKYGANLGMTHVPFKGGPPALTALLTGEVDMVISPLNSVLHHIKSGRVVAVAVSSSNRAKDLPAVSTLIESGFKDLDITAWYSIVAPAGTSPDIIKILHSALVRTIESSDIKSKIEAGGAQPITSTPEELAAFIGSEIAKWTKAARLAKVTPES